MLYIIVSRRAQPMKMRKQISNYITEIDLILIFLSALLTINAICLKKKLGNSF